MTFLELILVMTNMLFFIFMMNYRAMYKDASDSRDFWHKLYQSTDQDRIKLVRFILEGYETKAVIESRKDTN